MAKELEIVDKNVLTKKRGPSPVSIRERALRLMDRAIRIPESECWYFSGSLNSKGYGLTSIKSLWRAHVAAYVAAVGPVPEGMEIDHKCRQRSCVNPRHLEAVSHAENMRRSAGKNPTKCPFGHSDRVVISGKVRCRPCYVSAYRRNNAKKRKANQ